MTCPLLEYRDGTDDSPVEHRGDDERSFDVARAYCTAVDAFVQPMRADVCNDRYALHHADDCEFYRAHADAQGAGTSAADGDGATGVDDAGEDA